LADFLIMILEMRNSSNIFGMNPYLIDLRTKATLFGVIRTLDERWSIIYSYDLLFWSNFSKVSRCTVIYWL